MRFFTQRDPEPPRCSWCGERCRSQADLIAHQQPHAAEELAERLRAAAEAGLEHVTK